MSDAASRQVPAADRAVAGAAARAAASRARRPAWWSRDCCRRRASCLWAASPRSASPCWSPTSPCAGGRLGPRRVFHPRSAPCPDLPVRTSRPAVCQPPGAHAPRYGRRRGSESPRRHPRHRPSAQRAQGLNHFLSAARAAAAEIIVLDPLYSTHDQDENDTRAMAALCQSLLRLRDASRPPSSWCIMSANRSAVTKSAAPFVAPAPCMRWATVTCCSRGLLRNSPPSSLRFQFRYAAAQPPRLLQLDPQTLWFSSAGQPPAAAAPGAKWKRRRHTSPGRYRRTSALQPTARPNHGCHRMFQAHRSTGHHRGLPARLDRAGRRPIPPAAVAFAAARLRQWPPSIVRAGSRPSGCPRPMRRGWLRRNRLQHPPAHDSSCGRVWFPVLLAVSTSRRCDPRPPRNQAHFFGEVSERRPWAFKREDRPAAFAGRSASRSFGLLPLGYRSCLHRRVSYPTRALP